MKSLNEILQELNEGNVKLSPILRKETPVDFSKVSIGDVGVNEEGNFVIILDKGKYEEGAVLIKNIVSIRKWTNR